MSVLFYLHKHSSFCPHRRLGVLTLQKLSWSLWCNRSLVFVNPSSNVVASTADWRQSIFAGIFCSVVLSGKNHVLLFLWLFLKTRPYRKQFNRHHSFCSVDLYRNRWVVGNERHGAFRCLCGWPCKKLCVSNNVMKCTTRQWAPDARIHFLLLASGAMNICHLCPNRQSGALWPTSDRRKPETTTSAILSNQDLFRLSIHRTTHKTNPKSQKTTLQTWEQELNPDITACRKTLYCIMCWYIKMNGLSMYFRAQYVIFIKNIGIFFWASGPCPVVAEISAKLRLTCWVWPIDTSGMAEPMELKEARSKILLLQTFGHCRDGCICLLVQDARAVSRSVEDVSWWADTRPTIINKWTLFRPLL